MNSFKNKYLADYHVEIDKVSKKEWTELLMLFDDASINQTWSLGEVIKGEKSLSHFVLKKGNKIVSICQVSIKKIPIFNIGVADVYYGPLWHKRGQESNIQNFIQMIHCLKHEYTSNRNFLLRIWPNEFDDGKNEFSTILEKLGFFRNTLIPTKRTLFLDLSPSLESLRKNLGKTWRLHLNRAEKSKLSVIEGAEDHLYEIFLLHMKEMLCRKKFVPGVDYDKYKIIQKDLPDKLKMRIMVSTLEGKPVCSVVCSAIGDTGIFLFGATANESLKTNASNLLHWRMIQWLKENGYKRYDLGGIDPENTPGTYQFKRGLAGGLGEDRTQVGQFDFSRGLRGQLLLAVIRRIVPLRQWMLSKDLSISK
jgi:Acetyltransferase (GNAT) domain